MYREALALALQRHHPSAEVLLGSVESLDGNAESFGPHLLVRNDTDGADMESYRNTLCWVEILYSDGMDARVSLDGEVWNIEDISIDDLLELVEEVEKLIPAQMA
jgi:cobalamin biosynthesis Co2+ chelatase CbiK